MESQFINCVIHDEVAVLELDDPSANTLTYHLLRELEDRFLCLEGNPNIKGIMFTGKGEKFFSGGVNIGMLLTAGEKHNSHFILYAAEVLDYIQSSDKFVVAAINGNITGGGLELALISDHRLAVEGGYNIGFPEVRLGVIPGMGGTQRLSRLVGPQVALELITKGEFVSPKNAKKLGLVDKVFKQENFKERSLEYAQYVARNVPANHYKGYEAYDEIAEQQVIEGLVTTEIFNGIGTLKLTPKTLDSHPMSVLIAINDALLSFRIDDDIHAVLIDLNDGAINAVDTEHSLAESKCCPLLMRYARHVFSRIDGYPRIVGLYSQRILNDFEFELALACDYRFVKSDDQLANDTQALNQNSPSLARFEKVLPQKTGECRLNDLVESGFYTSVHSSDGVAWVLDWLHRFVPPMGAGQAIGYAKLSITRGYQGPLSAGLMLERHLQEQLFAAQDAKEGMSAYVEKRTPNFCGA